MTEKEQLLARFAHAREYEGLVSVHYSGDFEGLSKEGCYAAMNKFDAAPSERINNLDVWIARKGKM